MNHPRLHRSARRLVASGTMATLLIGMLAVSAPVVAKQFAAWSAPSSVGLESVNTTALEGCAMQSPDGLSLYFASDRARFTGDTRTDLDIWVAHRASTADDWDTPENLGDTINSAVTDFCPTPVRGKGLFFVSTRAGNGDIYFSRLNPAHGWTTPLSLGSNVNSSTLGEAGPSYFEADGRAFLYFSRGLDIYASEQASDGSWGLAAPVAELNSAFNDNRPNVRKNGLEVVFDSNRTPGGQGGLDIWTATRPSVADPWSTPINLAVLNTAAGELRASFSWDGSTLYFGRSPGPVGSSDLFFTTR